MYSCHILRKLEFSQQIFKKFSNIKFMKIRPVTSKLFMWLDGRTERGDKANS